VLITHKFGLGPLVYDFFFTAAPHVRVVMNPVTLSTNAQEGSAKKDAIYFSGHKFVGGPQTPGEKFYLYCKNKTVSEGRVSVEKRESVS